MSEKKRVNIYISDDVWKQARHISIDNNISVSELIERLLVEYLEKQSKKKG
ncbi:MAG: CopG family transcriptional regulator [Actinomycetota bacterium]